MNTVDQNAAMRVARPFPVEIPSATGPRTFNIMTTTAIAASDTRTLLVLVHGGTLTRSYWDSSYRPELYSFATWAARAGFASIAVDKLGVGESDRPPSESVTLHAQASAIHQLIQHERSRYEKVVLVAHSLGCWTGLVEAGTYHDVDGLVLTGSLHHLNTDEIDKSIDALHEANVDPVLADEGYPTGYITTKPGIRAKQWFDLRYTEAEVIDHDERTKSVVSTGEVATLGDAMDRELSRSINVPVMILNGDNDIAMSATPFSAGGPHIDAEPDYYSPAADLEMHIQPASGHNNCLHTSAPIHHALIIDWLKRRFS